MALSTPRDSLGRNSKHLVAYKEQPVLAIPLPWIQYLLQALQTSGKQTVLAVSNSGKEQPGLAVPAAREEQPLLAVLPPGVQHIPQVPVKQPPLAVSHPGDPRRQPALAVNPGVVQQPMQRSNPLQPPALPRGRQGTAPQPPLDMPELAVTQEMLRLH